MSEDNRLKKCLIFDFDGIILDTETAEVAVWHDLYAEAGLTFDMEAYLETIGRNDPFTFDPAEPLAKREGEQRSAEQIHKECRMRTFLHAQKLDLMEGVSELIVSAKARGCLLAVGSSAEHWWIQSHLTRLGIYDQFDTIVTFDDVENAKPAPDIFLKVLENLDVFRANALVFEDSQNGILAAHRAGIRAIAVPNSITKAQDFTLAEAVLPSLAHFDLDLFV
ncbi:MAG: HAD-IA family hydrolase [Chloroflexi bacterium]|jgi:HAD superfamily hydrolase (TIGR01509 family)|nr:HAD-IA family hydrolase [Chloroflexota bacterium]